MLLRRAKIKSAAIAISLTRPGSSPSRSGSASRDELHRHAVHAIAQAGRLRPVVEDMAEMAGAARAVDLGAGHQQAPVTSLADRPGKMIVEARPAGAAVELGRRGEQR